MKRLSNKRQNGGLAMVEYILCVPVLILLVLVVGELGRAMMQYNALTKACRDGVRYVAENALVGSTQVVTISNTVRTQTQNLVAFGNIVGAGTPRLPGLASANVTVTGTATADVIVSVSYDYDSIFGSIPNLVASGRTDTNLQFNAAVTMRAL